MLLTFQIRFCNYAQSEPITESATNKTVWIKKIKIKKKLEEIVDVNAFQFRKQKCAKKTPFRQCSMETYVISHYIISLIRLRLQHFYGHVVFDELPYHMLRVFCHFCIFYQLTNLDKLHKKNTRIKTFFLIKHFSIIFNFIITQSSIAAMVLIHYMFITQ